MDLPVFVALELSPRASPQALKHGLEATSTDTGMLYVERGGSCQNFYWNVEWKTAPGNHPQLEVTVPNKQTKTITALLLAVFICFLSSIVTNMYSTGILVL